MIGQTASIGARRDEKGQDMAVQTIWFYPNSTFSYVDPDLFNNINIAAGKEGSTLTVGQTADPQSFLINDTDSQPHVLNDRPLLGAGSQNQRLVAATTINGTTYPAGTSLGLGYAIEVHGSDGSSNTLGALVINGNVVGFVATNVPTQTQPLEAGVTYTVSSGPGTTSNANILYTNMAYCFARGTLIRTPRGDVAVEDLTPGDLLCTHDHGDQPIRWIGTRKLGPDELAANEKLRPIRIDEGALGPGTPAKDLVVSPQHRVLVSSGIAQRMFGTNQVLVAATQLRSVKGINIAADLTEVEYFHLLCDQHEVVEANGALTEKLFLGAEALKAIGPAARDEIFALFPEIEAGGSELSPVREIVQGGRARKLAERHVKNDKDMVSGSHAP